MNAPKPHPYADLQEALADPLARPLTLEQVLKRTGRSRRTITSWISQGLITAYTTRDGGRTVRVFLEREILEVHREMNERAAATRLNLRNQRARVDAAQPVDIEDQAPVDAEDLPPVDVDDAPPADDEAEDGRPPADLMLCFAIRDCLRHPGLRVGLFERAGTPTAFTQELVEEITAGVFGMITARIPSGLRWLEFANGSRIEFYTIAARLDAVRRHGSQLFHLVCLDSALPVDVQQFLYTRARGVAGSGLPVLGVRYSDCCRLEVQPRQLTPELEEPSHDVPPGIAEALAARMRPGYLPEPRLTVKVRGELDTSSLVASLREVGSVLADVVVRLERINGVELGAGMSAPADFRDPAVAEEIRDMRERNSAYTLERARRDIR